MPLSKVFTDLVNALEQPLSPKASAKLLHFRRSLSFFVRFLPNFPNISVFWEYELLSLSFLTLFLVPALYAGLLASSISPDTIRHSPPSAPPLFLSASPIGQLIQSSTRSDRMWRSHSACGFELERCVSRLSESIEIIQRVKNNRKLSFVQSSIPSPLPSFVLMCHFWLKVWKNCRKCRFPPPISCKIENFVVPLHRNFKVAPAKAAQVCVCWAQFQLHIHMIIRVCDLFGFFDDTCGRDLSLLQGVSYSLEDG